ncbi:MAG TPA: N-formylglutamate amidohydrolase [Polyangiaceae bacterium]|nr:N-formylglutamate amidohydrolase [Polyangiaceae bacterium]
MPVPVETQAFGTGIVVTCEHGSNALPDPFRFQEEDRWIVETHWAFDPGARPLALALAEELKGTAVVAGFSRLFADPNREETSTELFRRTAEGRPIALNRSISDADRAVRLHAYRAYHAAVDGAVRTSTAPIVFSMHTFTPIYEGKTRAVEIGVLFDEETALADALDGELSRAGFRVEPNEPYSGKLGLMYSVDRHAKAHGRRPIELEVRQDLAVQPDVQKHVVEATARALREFLGRG